MKNLQSALPQTLFYFLSFIMVALPAKLWAQVPRDIPTDTGPLEVDSTFDIILYIALPLLVIIFFFVYRAGKRKKEKNRDRER